MEKRISYLNKTFEDYKNSLIEFSKKYYPELSNSFNDASVGSWMIDLMASVADAESYHLDRAYQETNIDSANEMGSLMALARNNGVKIPGPKGAMAEVKISAICSKGDGTDGPIIKRGTRFASASQEFELLEDVDFATQFDENGNSNRTSIPNPNGTGYVVSKLAVVTAGESRVYRQYVTASDITPFMEIILPVENVMNIESIVVANGDITTSPSYGTFYGHCSDGTYKRYYEVDNLAQGWAWQETIDKSGEPVRYEYNGTYCVTQGEWKAIDHKFITEYTDKGYLKVIFGGGIESSEDLGDMSDASKAQISKILNSNTLGVLPSHNSTIFILYRVGGGKASNVAKGAINRISYLNAEFRDKTDISKIRTSLKVENTTPSISGKDMPTEKEIKYIIKYHRAAQERCVTVKDYVDRILMLPPKYGTPFRVGAMEANNKIMIYLLGIDSEGKLDTSLPLTLVKNIENYLSQYRMINDFVEIKSGRIINVSFDIEAIIDKNYNKSDVVNSIINTVEGYMDVNKHSMGEEIYIGDLEKEISKLDGVINLINLNVYNETGTGYSKTRIGQETIETNEGLLVDLEATDGILYNDGDSMIEIKKSESDIKVKIKER